MVAALGDVLEKVLIDFGKGDDLIVNPFFNFGLTIHKYTHLPSPDNVCDWVCQ